jgi:23S rRNA (guanosine2251-2'-O)-methyltransferase
MAIIISGKNAVLEALKANRKTFELYITKNHKSDALDLARSKSINIKEVDKPFLEGIAGHSNQGIAAKVEDYPLLTIEEALKKEQKNKVFLMLDQIEDPHNLGAILRSCDAFNVDAVIIPKRRSASLNQTVAKVSTGAIEHVDVVEVTNLNQTIDILKQNGFWIVGTMMDTKQTIHDIDVNTNLCVVIGNEGKGMSRLVTKNCDYSVKIPMGGHVNSLNASVSAAIVLYEIYHKKGM